VESVQQGRTAETLTDIQGTCTTFYTFHLDFEPDQSPIARLTAPNISRKLTGRKTGEIRFRRQTIFRVQSDADP
jgi:hypothetical protein